MATATEELRAQVVEYLDEVKDPCSVASGKPMGLAEMGLVRSVEISPAGEVAVRLRLTSPFCEMIGFFKSEVLAKIGALPAVESVTLETDSGLDWSPAEMAPHLRRQRQERLLALRAEPAVRSSSDSTRKELS